MVESLGLNTGRFHPRIVQNRRWFEELRSAPAETTLIEMAKLISFCQADSFWLGNGQQIISGICERIERETKRELIFVTCFWAQSESQEILCKTLKRLSEKSLSSRSSSKIRVRICLSSVSLFQKLFHTSSALGQVYEPSQWSEKLNLPPPEELSGLDLQVKSVFILPFSVMHPKFVIIDQRICLLPSCNVSWENWLEGCIAIRGLVVESFFRFWQNFWGRGQPSFDLPEMDQTSLPDAVLSMDLSDSHHLNDGLTPLPSINRLEPGTPPAMFLPSQHHRNPLFRPFPYQAAPKPPATPLNTYTLRIIDDAQHTIYMQTPNLTSPPVIAALQKALLRGVQVTILTNERLMLLEQLVTAGTTTSRCLKKLIKAHKAMPSPRTSDLSQQDASEIDLEDGVAVRGGLHIYYFVAEGHAQSRGPIQSHLKLTIVDDNIVVLGSGNMDRASWYTSQELGLAVISAEKAKSIRKQVDFVLSRRRKSVYDQR